MISILYLRSLSFVEDDQLYASFGDRFHDPSRLCLASEIMDCGIVKRKPRSALCVTSAQTLR